MSWFTKIAQGGPGNIAENPELQNQHEIREDLIPAVEKKLKPLINKAVKLGLEPIRLDLSAPFPKEYTDAEGRKSYANYVTVTVIGEAPQLAGWEFVAKITHLPDENNPGQWRNNIPSNEPFPPIYWTSPPQCEHCNLVRNRNFTYLLKNEQTGEYKQVASTCINDFLGHPNANATIDYIAQFNDVDQILEEAERESQEYGTVGPGGGWGGYVRDTDEVLAYMAALARNKPSLSNKQITEIIKEYFWFGGSWAYDDIVQPSDEDKAFAQNARQWMLSRDGEPGLGNFEQNMINTIQSNQMGYRGVGISVWLFTKYKEHLQANQPQEEKVQSQALGNVGDKILIKGSYVTSRSFDGNYGTVFYHDFVTPNGSKVTWRTGKGPNGLGLAEGQEYYLQGTVKGHKEFRGDTSTTIVGTLVPEPKVPAWKKKVTHDFTE